MTSSPEETQPGGPRQPALPQLDWLLERARPQPSDPEVFDSLLVAFRPKALPEVAGGQPMPPLQVFATLVWLPARMRSPKFIRVPSWFGAPTLPDERVAELDCCVLFVARSFLPQLVACEAWQRAVRRVELGPALDPGLFGSSPNPAVPVGQAALSDRNEAVSRRVLMGVIDEGIPFAHTRFRHPGGTRIAHLWQQGVAGSGVMPGDPGRTLTAATIDAALNHHRGDEDRVYRDIGGLDYALPGVKALGRSRSHGAHVLDLAAGADPGAQVINRPIVAVDMPDAAIGNPAGSMLTPHALLGLLFILQKAQAMRCDGETLPVIVTLSYGPHEGPHDGTSLLEVFMDWLLRATANSATPMRIVLAAGNARQARVHASFLLKPAEPRRLAWRLQPASLVQSRLQIVLPAGMQPDLAVSLTGPSGGAPVAVRPNAPSADLRDAQNGLVAQLRYLRDPLRVGDTVELTVAPTSQDPAQQPNAIAPSGLWTVELSLGSGSNALQVHAWIARADTPSGRPARGRQSYFDDPDYARFDASGRPLLADPSGTTSYVRRSGTLSGIATGVCTDVVGARAVDDPNPRRYSSVGPDLNLPTPRNAPECLAPGDRSAARRGMLAAGTRSASVRAMNGTSVAAPQAARWLADQWLATGALPSLPPTLP